MEWRRMKAVILAGGLGSRLSEETELKPKPMVEIGGQPILWHIMKIYSAYGVNDFVVCCGYKGHLIKQYFADYFMHTSDVTFDLSSNRMLVHRVRSEPWKVTLVNTGAHSETGGRLLKVRQHLEPNEPFHFTYGDGVSNVDIAALSRLHATAGTAATLTAVIPPSRFGALQMEGNLVTQFLEKPAGEQGLINGGYMVLSPRIFDFLDCDCSFESRIMPRLAEAEQLSAYTHTGFWHPMDTLRDKRHLEALWDSGRAPWKMWGENPHTNETTLDDRVQTSVVPSHDKLTASTPRIVRRGASIGIRRRNSAEF